MQSLAVEDQPPKLEVLPWCAWIWRAWHSLNPERVKEVAGVAAPMGGMMIRSVPGRIPWTAIDAWCRRAGRGDADMAFLAEMIAQMDDEYLTWWNARQAAA